MHRFCYFRGSWSLPPTGDVTTGIITSSPPCDAVWKGVYAREKERGNDFFSSVSTVSLPWPPALSGDLSVFEPVCAFFFFYVCRFAQLFVGLSSLYTYMIKKSCKIKNLKIDLTVRSRNYKVASYSRNLINTIIGTIVLSNLDTVNRYSHHMENIYI